MRPALTVGTKPAVVGQVMGAQGAAAVGVLGWSAHKMEKGGPDRV